MLLAPAGPTFLVFVFVFTLAVFELYELPLGPTLFVVFVLFVLTGLALPPPWLDELELLDE